MSALLARRQRWLYDAIVDPTAPAVLQRHLGGTAVPAEIGLAVYRHAYRARLRDCIADDFPAVAHAMGTAVFARTADAFIAERPPCDATLNAYGRFFPAWLATRRLNGRARLVELAQLEWALVEAVHAPLATPLRGLDLAGIAPHAWGEIRLRVSPSLRVLPGRFNTNARFEAFLRQRPLPAVQRVVGGIAVIRQPTGLQRHSLNATETTVLQRLANGATLADALAAVVTTRTSAAAAQMTLVQHAFTRWVAHGFFTSLN